MLRALQFSPVRVSCSRIRMREQPASLIINIKTNGPRDDGMFALIDYLTGANAEGRSIALKAPLKRICEDQIGVHSSASLSHSVNEVSEVSFSISGYEGRLPEPESPNIRLTNMPPCRVLSLRFPGPPTPSRIAFHKERLRDFMGAYGILPAGAEKGTSVVSISDYGFCCFSELSVRVSPWPQPARPRLVGAVLKRRGFKYAERVRRML
jgi:hypothetical protein